MSAELDNAFQTHRTRLTNLVASQAALAWQQMHNEREQAVAMSVSIVESGQRATAQLVDAYMVASAREVGHTISARGLDPAAYTTEVLRGIPASEVYDRPFGALGGQLEQGAEFATAMQSAQAALDRLVRTDLQLSHTNAARDWMQGEERVVGYRRVLGGAHHCPLCISASSRTYRKADLMPIHERCHCSVAPVFGRESVASVGTDVRVEHDPEIGPRLVADSWSSTGPRLLS